jgi:hypothetical protein
VSVYVSNNSVPVADLLVRLKSVYAALTKAAQGQQEEAKVELMPAVSVRKSVTPDYIICLEEEAQVAQAPSAHDARHDARAVPRQVGATSGLPDGCAELR